MKKTLVTFIAFIFFLNVYSQFSSSSTTNTVVTNAGCLDDSLTNPRAVVITDISGNFFVTWSDNRSGKKNVYVQKFNATGVAQWTVNGVRIAASTNYQVTPQVAADDVGGCVVVWADTAVGSTTSYDIKVQKFNSTGAPQWTSGGITICNAIRHQANPKIIPDGGGGYYISWYDDRASAGTGSIYLQRINSSGTAQYAANGIIVNGSVIQYPEQQFLLKEGTNAIIVYSQFNGVDYDIKAQKYNTAGTAQWGVSGINVIATTNEEAYFDAAIDNSGNVFVAWESYVPPSFAEANVFVQKVNSAGVLQWTTTGVVASAAVSDQFWPAVAPDNAGGVIVTWEDYSQDIGNTFSDIYAQKFNTAGTAAFAANGIAVCNATDSQNTPRVVSDGGGGAVVVWPDLRTDGTTSDLYGQRINNTGTPQWTANGVLVANAANYQAGQDLVVSNSGVIAGFYDDRATSLCFNLYLQRINFDGTQGNLPTSVPDIIPVKDKIKVYPTLMHDVLIIENNNSYVVEMRMIDISGKEVLRRSIAAGSKISVAVDGLPAGVYLSDYLLKDGRRVKLPLMKQ
ncbi:MAG: hypothetical protein HYX40_12270 [Sphingobacteriales bacterium]|nr:hypothetical protein [Sphingobacteriales bacterium]